MYLRKRNFKVKTEVALTCTNLLSNIEKLLETIR